MKTYIDRLIQIREEKLEFSIRQFAKFLDLNYMYYYQIEKKKRKISGKLLEALASKGFNSNWVLTGEGQMMENIGKADLIKGSCLEKSMKPEIKELIEILENMEDIKLKAIIKIIKGLIELID